MIVWVTCPLTQVVPQVVHEKVQWRVALVGRGGGRDGPSRRADPGRPPPQDSGARGHLARQWTRGRRVAAEHTRPPLHSREGPRRRRRRPRREGHLCRGNV